MMVGRYLFSHTVGRYMVAILDTVLVFDLCHNILTPEHHIINTGRVVGEGYERRLGWTVPNVLQKSIPILSLYSSRQPWRQRKMVNTHTCTMYTKLIMSSG